MYIYKKKLYILVLFAALFCIFGFLIFSRSNNSDMIKEANCGEILKKIRSKDVTDIVKKYIPIGLSYKETINRLENMGMEVKHLYGEGYSHILTDKEYSAKYVYYWGWTWTDMLSIRMTFSKKNKLDEVKAWCYKESL